MLSQWLSATWCILSSIREDLVYESLKESNR